MMGFNKKSIVTPISSKLIVGSDVRYENIFELLQDEIAKSNQPDTSSFASLDKNKKSLSIKTEDEGPDWVVAAELAEEILSKHSKDLLVLSYYCVAQIYVNDFDGLLNGLKIYLNFIVSFWENMFPERDRARSMSLEWWLERMLIALEQGDFVQKITEKQAKDIFNNLDKIDKFLKSNSFDFGNKISEIKNCLFQVKKIEDEPLRGLKAFANKTVSKLKGKMVETGNVDKDFKVGLKVIRLKAGELRSKKISDACAYRLSRIALWENIEELPPIKEGTDNKITVIVPPRMEDFEYMLKKEDWEQLLKSSETRIFDPSYTFALDLNRYVATALSNMGSKFQLASEAVCRETSWFVNRLEGVEKLKFSNGRPFADIDTRDWIKEDLKKTEKLSGKNFTNIAISFSSPSIARSVKKIRRIAVREKKIDQAFKTIQKHIRTEASQKTVIQWRLALLEIMVECGSKSWLIQSNINQVLSVIDDFSLELWDPDLALSIFVTLYQICKNKSEVKYKNMALDLLDRIGCLDLFVLTKMDH